MLAESKLESLSANSGTFCGAFLMLRENKWTLTALTMILAALFLTRGGLASLLPLLRALIPVIIAVLGYRYLRSKITETMNQHRYSGNHRSSDQNRVIDLCPRCGSYLKPGHRCQG